MDRRRPQQQRVDQTEHGRRRTDAERDRDHDGGREARRLAQDADGVPQVARQILEPPGAARAPHLLLRLLDAAELEQRPPARLLRVHAAPHVLLRLPLDVVAQLLVELALLAATEEYAAHILA